MTLLPIALVPSCSSRSFYYTTWNANWYERYGRYEPEVAEALTEMFVSGTSTHKVGKVAQTLMGVAPSASAVSRLNQTLTEQFDAWRERPLLTHYRLLYLDGIHFTVRHGGKTDSTIICLYHLRGGICQ